MNTVGEPYSGKPNVWFDEGRLARSAWAGPAAYSTNLGAGHRDGSRSRSGRPISKATVHSYMRAINGFLSWARSQGEGERPAAASLPSASESSTRSHVRRSSAWDAADSERDKLVVRLLADTGKLLALRPDDIRVEGGRNVLKVRGKGDRERLVPLSPSLARRLKRFAGRARGEPAAIACSSPFAAGGRAESSTQSPNRPSNR
jgi:integrase